MVLQETTFEKLFKEEKLPSGYSFRLMPDTVEVALRVAEVEDIFPWRTKALQAVAVLANVEHVDVQDRDKGGIDFVSKMLDIDVIFIALAWTAQLNGFSIKLTDPGVPCPSCGESFTAIPFGEIKLFRRVEPASGVDTTIELKDLVQEDLPESIRGGKLFMTDPTWKAARQNLTEKSWATPEVVAMYRAMSCMLHSSEGKPPRQLSMAGEAKKIKMRAMQSIVQQMDHFVPHFQPTLGMTCKGCKETITVPFEQGL